MTTDNFCFYLQNRSIQTSQTGGQRYSDTSFPALIFKQLKNGLAYYGKKFYWTSPRRIFVQVGNWIFLWVDSPSPGTRIRHIPSFKTVGQFCKEIYKCNFRPGPMLKTTYSCKLRPLQCLEIMLSTFICFDCNLKIVNKCLNNHIYSYL
jgi:hypothetical protein